MRIERLDQNTKKNLLEDLLKRSPNSYGKYEESVREILDAVKDRGDEALFEYTKKFDGAEISASNILVTEEEIREAYDKVDPGLIDVIRKALVNIRSYHEKQMQYSWFDSRPDGTILGQKVTALAKVGVYVPGGKAAYPSSVLMNIMPAKVAGVDEIIMVTPPGKDGKVTPTTLEYIKPAGHRQSRRWHTARRASRRWIRSWDRAISTWPWQRKRCTAMSALIPSPGPARSSSWRMRRRIPAMWLLTCSHRQSMMSLPARSS